MKSLEHRYETMLVDEVKPGIVTVTLNRPDRYNAMTNTMFVELEHLAWALGTEDACRVVIVTGAGKAFCSGYDLADADDLPNLGALGMLDQQERAARALTAIRSLRVPVIAAVNGPAAGGGLALALAADIRLAGRSAKFNAAFVKIGLSAGDLGTSWLLTRLIGPAKTSEICFTGRIVDAARGGRARPRQLGQHRRRRRRRARARRADRRQLARWRAAFQAGVAGQPRGGLVRGRDRTREPWPGPAHAQPGHARGAHRIQGEACTGLPGQVIPPPISARAESRATDDLRLSRSRNPHLRGGGPRRRAAADEPSGPDELADRSHVPRLPDRRTGIARQRSARPHRHRGRRARVLRRFRSRRDFGDHRHGGPGVPQVPGDRDRRDPVDSPPAVPGDRRHPRPRHRRRPGVGARRGHPPRSAVAEDQRGVRQGRTVGRRVGDVVQPHAPGGSRHGPPRSPTRRASWTRTRHSGSAWSTPSSQPRPCSPRRGRWRA